MKAVIPAAKKEDELFPFTESKPTGLLPVMGTPIIDHLINDLEEAGVDEIYIVTNYRSEMFEEEYEEHSKVNLVEQQELSGTASAVAECDFIEEDFVVVNGDVVVSGGDIESLIQKHENSDSKATILGTDEDKPEKFGVLSITHDQIDALEEKPDEPENTLVNTGIYAFSPEIFDAIDELEGEQKDLTEAVKQFIESEEVRFELIEDYWIDIGSPRKLWKADQTVREYEIEETDIHEHAEVSDSADITGEAVIEDGAEVKAGTVVEGKVFIGEGSTVGPNATVRDSTLCENSQVRAADIDSSALFESAIVDPSTAVEQAVLAEETDVKANTSIRESFIGPRSFVEVNNSIYGVKFVPDARTDLGEISK